MRLFIAIDFPEDIKEILLQKIELFKKSFPEFKWIKKPALHLTIKFIGETEPALAQEIPSRLKDALNKMPSFSLSTSQLGFFPSAQRARVFFLDLVQSEDLNNCFNIIEVQLLSLGIEKEKRHFHPHITLARIKNRIITITESDTLVSQTVPEMTMMVKEIILMQSELFASGARYTPVQRFSLRTI